jgi:hypothetical protein
MSTDTTNTSPVTLAHPAGTVRLIASIDVSLVELLPGLLDVADQPDRDGWQLGPAAGDPCHDQYKTLADLAVGDGAPARIARPDNAHNQKHGTGRDRHGARARPAAARATRQARAAVARPVRRDVAAVAPQTQSCGLAARARPRPPRPTRAPLCDDAPDTASIVTEAAGWLRRLRPPLTLVVNKVRRSSQIEITALQRETDFAQGITITARDEKAAAELHGSRFSRNRAPAGRRIPVSETAALLAPDWPTLDLTHRPAPAC